MRASVSSSDALAAISSMISLEGGEQVVSPRSAGIGAPAPFFFTRAQVPSVPHAKYSPSAYL